jgi:hypothetical protein
MGLLALPVPRLYVFWVHIQQEEKCIMWQWNFYNFLSDRLRAWERSSFSPRPPDDGLNMNPEHVEAWYQNKVKNSASCWFVIRLSHLKTKAHTARRNTVPYGSDDCVWQGSSTRGPRSPLPWPAGRFEKITTNTSPARCLHII